MMRIRSYFCAAVLSLGTTASSVAGAPEKQFKDLDCVPLCDQNKSICLRIDGVDANGAGLRSAYESLRSNAVKIPASDLRGWFGVDKDPCARGDTDLANGVWTNRGQSCDVHSNVDLGLGLKYKLKLEVPGRFAFRRKAVGDRIILEAYSAPARLVIDDQDVNAGFGGYVLRVTATPSKAYFQMPSGCIKVPYA